MLEIRKEENGSYRFVVKSQEGHELLASVPFPDRAAATRSVRSLKPLLQNPSCFERRTDHLGRFHFTLRGADGSLLGQSQFYRSEAGMENGIKNTLRRLSSLELE